MRYILLDGEQLDWDMEDVHKFDRLYKQGKSIWEICKELKCNKVVAAAFILDRAEKGYISKEQFGKGISL